MNLLIKYVLKLIFLDYLLQEKEGLAEEGDGALPIMRRESFPISIWSKWDEASALLISRVGWFQLIIQA